MWAERKLSCENIAYQECAGSKRSILEKSYLP